MTILLIVLLVLVGLCLLILELMVIPGTTIAGVAGFLMLIGGVYLTYDHYGNFVGHISLSLIVLVSVISVYFALKSNTWKYFILDTKIEGKVENFKESSISLGDSGVSVTRLAPMGKALINSQEVEVKSSGEYIDEQTSLEVIKIEQNSIIVKIKI